jgi:multicomponent Na+:H+ antiporter subunit A
VPDGDGRNVVNVILVDFRGIDTMGEITVLAAAAIGSVALARAGRRPRSVRGRDGAPDASPPTPAERTASGKMQRLVVVDVAVRIVFIAVMVGSIYLLFAGHNQPGGGFVGGIVAGAAVALRYVAGGIDDVRALSRAHPWTVLGTGLLISAATVIVPILLGQAPLEHAKWEADLPLLGHVKVTSALAFDIGVYLVVLGLVLMVFESFGDEPRRLATADADDELHDSTGAPAAPLPEAEEVPAS